MTEVKYIADITTFPMSLETMLATHRRTIRFLEFAIDHARTVKSWSDVIDFSIDLRDIVDLCEERKETFNFAFGITAFNNLSSRRQKKYAAILEALVAAFEAYLSGCNFDLLFNVYDDFTVLIKCAHCEELENLNIRTGLRIRFYIWQMERRYRRWNKC